MNRITSISANGITLIRQYEGCKLAAYLCPAGVWTIGIGTTRYPGGKRVQKGDKITEAVAIQLFRGDVKTFEKQVDDLTRDDLTQQEFDALVSFCYNEGAGNLMASTLLKKVNMRTSDPQEILTRFMAYNKARVDGKLKELPGLTKRRASEAHLYSLGSLDF